MSYRLAQHTRHIEEWTFRNEPEAEWPQWVRDNGCTYVIHEGRPAVRHRMGSNNVQVYFQGDSIGRDPDGTAGFVSARPVK
jgi:hypothetical protein